MGTILDCTADFCFNLGGMLTPGINFGSNESKAIFLALMYVCIGAYGILEVFSAGSENPEGDRDG